MISIIIPCYNVETTIHKTLESVLNQTNKEWEIIAINDGSVDKTGDILNEYSKRYDNIKVYYQRNGGVSKARNKGIKHSNGEWLYFLDADDTIDRSFIKEINSLIDSKTDLILFGFNTIKPHINKSYEPYESCSYLKDFLLYKLPIHICSIICRKEFIYQNSIWFNENIYIGEDREYIYKILLNAPKINVTKKKYYNYFFYSDSSNHIPIYSYKTFSAIATYERIYLELMNTGYRDAALIHLKSIIITHQKNIKKWSCDDVNLKKNLEKKADKYLKQYNCISLNKITWYTNMASLIYKNKYCYNLFIRILDFLKIG